MRSKELTELLRISLGSTIRLLSADPVAGGCINQCFRLTTTERIFFLKMNQPGSLDMFKKEQDGLKALASAGNLLVPRPIATGVTEKNSYLIMEFIQSSSPNANYWEQLGVGLAGLHKKTNDFFGWESNNYIGSLPQSNQKHLKWSDFLISERLQPQIRLARDTGKLQASTGKDLEHLCNRIDLLLVAEPPALLHGDLWSGNVMVGAEGEPCLVDPAVYYGHREIELAFTTLFGGFDQRFYQSYIQAYPLTQGYQQRFDLYNIYPLLVHLNLFGGGYLAQIQHIVGRYGK